MRDMACGSFLWYHVPMHDKLPDMFRPILWSYDFNRIDPLKHQKTIVVQAVNYGTLAHWRWLKERYGRDGASRGLMALSRRTRRAVIALRPVSSGS